MERVAWHLWAVLVVLFAAAAFLVPAWRATHGVWPAPLDDTYIYFGCARSLALGEPFVWFPGNGYSSGCTSNLYPMILAPLWAAGLRGTSLVIGSSAVAVAAVFDLARSLRRISQEHPASWLFPPIVVAIPLLSWSWFAGMETALLGALLGRSMLAAHRAMHTLRPARSGSPADPPRAQRQFRAGLWLAAVALTRPETTPFVIATAVALAYRGGAIPVWRSFARGVGPASVALLIQAVANRMFTGDWAQAGAVRKALWSSPYVTEPEIALAWAGNLVVLLDQALARGLGGTAMALALPLLAVISVVLPRHRALSTCALSGAAGALAIVCLNSTARYQNYRYVAPTLMLLLISAALGLHALARRRRGWPIGALLAAMGILAPARQAKLQRDHFARASANIVQQHMVVAERIEKMSPRPRRIFVNDAGVIPYLLEIPPIDGFGLGSFRGLPFARASVHGQPAVIELIERLPPEERPDLLALYPNWWEHLVSHFGRRLDSVRIADNVICGHDEKVIYAADWSALADPSSRPSGAVDTIDLADLVSEREHALRFPQPHGGWVVGRTLRQGTTSRYDAGRVIPPGRALSFRVAGGVGVGQGTLRLRTQHARSVRVTVARDGVRLAEALAVPIPPLTDGHWLRLEAKLSNVAGGDRVELIGDGFFEAYTIWITRP